MDVKYELKTMLELVEGGRCVIKMYGNDGFDKQEEIDGNKYFAEWIKRILSDKSDMIDGIISESDCDYRNKACANTGETINGKWVCSNHKRTAGCQHSEDDVAEDEDGYMICGACGKYGADC